jgi:hypothetical protein
MAVHSIGEAAPGIARTLHVTSGCVHQEHPFGGRRRCERLTRDNLAHTMDGCTIAQWLNWKPWARRHPPSGSSGENVRRRAPRCQQPIGPTTVNACMHSRIGVWRGNGIQWRGQGMLAIGDECMHPLRANDASETSIAHACMQSWRECGVGVNPWRTPVAIPRGNTPGSRIIALMHGCSVYACAPRLTGITEEAG